MNISEALASRLRHRITVEQQQLTSDEAGGYTHDWNEVASLWADIQPVASRAGSVERFIAGHIEAHNAYVITTRYVSGITPAMRISYGNRIFNIRSVINVGERNKQLEILAEEGVAV